jgi:hypothetical protein
MRWAGVFTDSLSDVCVPGVSKTGLRCHGRCPSIRLGSHPTFFSLPYFPADLLFDIHVRRVSTRL